MGLATGEGSSEQGKKLNSCASKADDCSHLATSVLRPSSTPLNIMLSVAEALHNHGSLKHALRFSTTLPRDGNLQKRSSGSLGPH